MQHCCAQKSEAYNLLNPALISAIPAKNNIIEMKADYVIC